MLTSSTILSEKQFSCTLKKKTSIDLHKDYAFTKLCIPIVLVGPAQKLAFCTTTIGLDAKKITCLVVEAYPDFHQPDLDRMGW